MTEKKKDSIYIEFKTLNRKHKTMKKNIQKFNPRQYYRNKTHTILKNCVQGKISTPRLISRYIIVKQLNFKYKKILSKPPSHKNTYKQQ